MEQQNQLSIRAHNSVEEKREFYNIISKQAEALIADNVHLVSTLSNLSALLYQSLEDVNWVGFYLMEKGVLYLGPFQGNVACVEIMEGKGVCGTAALKDQTIRVKDVHEFDGHIACDATTNSEIVIPIHFMGEVVAVLDIDSRAFDRFDQEDQSGLEKVVKIVENYWEPFFKVQTKK